MLRKLLVAIPLIIFASLVLFISLLRVASVRYEYQGQMNKDKVFLSTPDSRVDYSLPFSGGVLPDSPFWSIKVLRDKLWLFITTDATRRADLQLLFADKRVGSAKILFEQNKPALGVATLEKAEGYLIAASESEKKIRASGGDTKDLLDRLNRASLKHYELIARMYDSAPDEARPLIIRFKEIPKKVYEDARNGQLEKGIVPYGNPFVWN
jgi:hypothetical protein